MKIPKVSLSKGLPLLKLLRYSIIIITISSLFFQGYNIWQENHQIEPILKEVGDELFNPIYNLHTHSEFVYENGFRQPELGFFRSIGIFFANLFFIFQPLIIIYFSFYYIFLFAEKFIVMDESRKMSSFLVASIIFIGIQWLYILAFTELPLKTPFESIGNIFRILSKSFS